VTMEIIEIGMAVQVSARLRLGTSAQGAMRRLRMCARRYVVTARIWGCSSVTTGTYWKMTGATLGVRRKHSMYALGGLLPLLTNASRLSKLGNSMSVSNSPVNSLTLVRVQ